MAAETSEQTEGVEEGEEPRFSNDPIQIVDVGWTESMLSKLQNMRQSGALCDVMLVSSSGNSFKVHSSVLAAASPYFQQLLQDQITPTYILKTDVSDDVWTQILEYVYTGHTGVSNENLDTVVEMAEQFGLENLSQELNEIQAENLVSEEEDVDEETATREGSVENEGENVLSGVTATPVKGSMSRKLIGPDADNHQDGDGEIKKKRKQAATPKQTCVCELCGRTFPSVRSMMLHEGHMHKDVSADFMCNVCKRHFRTQHSCGLHEAQHTYLTCHICSKGFSNQEQLDVHIVLHDGGRPFVCALCGMSYRHDRSLKSHEAICLGRDSEGRRLAKPAFQCMQCGSTFLSKKGMELHEMIHRGDRPVRCQICGATFRKKQNLILHNRTHSGERPYKCEVCSKAFTDGSALRRHFRIHTGEKPYQCPFCPIAFNQSQVLKAHLVAKHGHVTPEGGKKRTSAGIPRESSKTPFMIKMEGDFPTAEVDEKGMLEVQNAEAIMYIMEPVNELNG